MFMQFRVAHLAGLIRHPVEQTDSFTYFDNLRLRPNGFPLDRRVGIDQLFPTGVDLPGRRIDLSRPTEMRGRSDHPTDAVKPVYGRVDEAVVRVDALITVNGVVFVE